MASRPTSQEPSYGTNRKSCKNSHSMNPRNLSSLVMGVASPAHSKKSTYVVVLKHK